MLPAMLLLLRLRLQRVYYQAGLAPMGASRQLEARSQLHADCSLQNISRSASLTLCNLIQVLVCAGKQPGL